MVQATLFCSIFIDVAAACMHTNTYIWSMLMMHIPGGIWWIIILSNVPITLSYQKWLAPMYFQNGQNSEGLNWVTIYTEANNFW